MYKLTAVALLVLTCSLTARADSSFTKCTQWNEWSHADSKTSALIKAVWIDGFAEGLTFSADKDHPEGAAILFLPRGLRAGEIVSRVDSYCIEHQDVMLWQALADVTAQFHKASSPEK